MLAASRAAMHDALALRRAHAPDARPVGYYDPAGGSSGDVVVPRAKGQHFRTMGRADRTGEVHLRPEEALYLLERGSLELRARVGVGMSGKKEGEEVVVGLQSAYATLLGQDGLTLERFQVFAGLRRSGYIVQRAPDWAGREWRVGRRASTGASARPQGYADWIWPLLGGAPSARTRPLVAIGLYRSYGEGC